MPGRVATEQPEGVLEAGVVVGIAGKKRRRDVRDRGRFGQEPGELEGELTNGVLLETPLRFALSLGRLLEVLNQAGPG